MLNSIKFLTWTVTMLAFVIYIVAIYFTQVVHDHMSKLDQSRARTRSQEHLEKHFGDLGKTFISLFQAITGGIDWIELTDPLDKELSGFVSWIFLLYIAFAVLAMLNVITGVFVETTLKNAKADSDFLIVNNVRQLFGRRDRWLTWPPSRRSCTRRRS